MPKLLKSEHLNDELWKAEKELSTVAGDSILRLGVKVLILIAKVIRDMRHNQVETMKKMGVNMSKPVRKPDEGSKKDA